MLLGIIAIGAATVSTRTSSPSPTKPVAEASATATPTSSPGSAPEIPNKPLTPAERAKAQKEEEAAREALRVAFGKRLEDNMLSEGLSVDVYVRGARKTQLTLKYPLVSKAMAYKVTQEQQGFLETAKELGFTKFVMTDGYDDTWTWDLTK